MARRPILPPAHHAAGVLLCLEEPDRFREDGDGRLAVARLAEDPAGHLPKPGSQQRDGGLVGEPDRFLQMDQRAADIAHLLCERGETKNEGAATNPLLDRKI